MSGSEINEKKEEQSDGVKYTINKTLQILSRAKYRFDICGDVGYPSAIVTTKPFTKALLDIKNKGIKIRFITEITKDNLFYCKELIQIVGEVRHLDGVKGNFTVTDRDYVSYAILSEEIRPSSLTKAVTSTSKEFVNQQQQFFDMLWDKAIPAELKMKEMESGVMLPERTEIITGPENILRLTLESLPQIRESIDNCSDSNSSASFVLVEPMWNYLKELASTKKGVRFRFITEITKDNLLYCKELAKILELRHLDEIKGNLGIIDGREYRTSPSIKPRGPPDVLIRSTAKIFVEQQQFFFETLWNKAIPAEKKIREIEEGIPAEVTETWYGVDNILKKSWEVISAAQVTADACHDSKSPLTLVSNEQYLQMMLQLKSKGVRQRFIIEITNENVKYCKELAKYVQLRHLEGVKGNFTIIDARYYGTIANLSEFQPPSEFIHSTAKVFVEQQQFFFETLWNKAIPAEQRIREIEEGRAPERLEIIQDTQKSISRAFDIMNKTQKELLVLFATPRTFTLALQAKAGDIYRKISKNGVEVKFVGTKSRH